MDPRSRSIFSRHKENLLARAVRSFSLSESALKEKGAFESIVFECSRNDHPAILKFTHSLHRSVDQIAGELEFVEALAAEGVPVSVPLHTDNGQSTVVVPIEDGFFVILCYPRAPGEPTRPPDWTVDLIRNWGEITARMHRTAMHYQPSRPEIRRFTWQDDPTLDYGRRLAESEPLVAQRFEETLAALRALPETRDTYGLVHSDLHHGNFFVDQGQLYPFDFDDCHYNWFLQDIAMPLLYATLDLNFAQGPVDSPTEFLNRFLEGYARHNTVAAEHLDRLTLFLTLRELDLYAILSQIPGIEENPWAKSFLDGRRARIESRRPVLELAL